MPRRDRLIVGAGGQVVGDRVAGMQHGCDDGQIHDRRDDGHPRPLLGIQSDHSGGQPAGVNVAEWNHLSEDAVMRLGLLARERVPACERIPGALDSGHDPAADLEIQAPRALDRGHHRPYHPDRLGASLPRHGGDQLTPVEDAQPLDRIELMDHLEKCRHLGCARPVERTATDGGLPGARRYGRLRLRGPLRRSRRRRHRVGGLDVQRSQRNRLLERDPERLQLGWCQLAPTAQNAGPVDDGLHRRPTRVAREMISHRSQR